MVTSFSRCFRVVSGVLGAGLMAFACSSTPGPDVAPGGSGSGATSGDPGGATTTLAEVVSATTTQAASTAAPAPSPGTAPEAPSSSAGAPVTSGSASAAPAKDLGPPYLACGCGCCGEVPPEKRCLYHSKGDDMRKIIAADKAARKRPACARKGCSMGLEYRYCD